MRHWRTARRDTNHVEIVRALRAAGASVLELHAVGGGCPDLLVGYRRYNYLLEVKRPGVAGRKRGAVQNATNDAQASFAARWRGGSVHTVEEPLQALWTIGATRGSDP